MRNLSARRLAIAAAATAIFAIVLYVGATIASRIEYNMTEAAALPVDGPPAAILIVGTIGMLLGAAALVLLLAALILHKATGQKATGTAQ
ncbi:hypothetical protein [Arthrobacter sp. TMS2-4]